MSEEILKALTQLFAITTKQDGGTSQAERDYVVQYFKQNLNPDLVKEYTALYEQLADYGTTQETEEIKLTSVKDSVKILGICRKINKTLQQKQKIIALLKVLELVASDRNFTPQRVSIIKTVYEVFKISDNYNLLEQFVAEDDPALLYGYSEILTVDGLPDVEGRQSKHIFNEHLHGAIVFAYIASEDLIFAKYTGREEVYLNGFLMAPRQIYLFSHGSTIKMSRSGAPLYYSDIVEHFRDSLNIANISFNVSDLEYKFPNGAIGLRNINLSESAGKLVAIMGGSGAGKTTLLNVLAGIEQPSQGAVKVNGIDLHKQNDQVKGLIGYVAQDDILFEDLTVYQNLFFNAKLCFKGKTDTELEVMVLKTLRELGLAHIRNLKVGNVLNKKISGGQRKRLNIALELIREPSVMFVDEPTSGLSSRDSENVMDLLKELTLKGKLIFVVIHQPSSDIFKMFDKLYILDNGGYLIFNGNPIEAVTYFKEVTNQIETGGQCGTCGNVNPEQIFNIIEARVVDEYGQFSDQRKISPPQWNELYHDNFKFEPNPDIDDALPASLEIPKRGSQWKVFTTRDLLSKIGNLQYLLVNLLEAPVLAFLLAFIIRYNNDPTGPGKYIFRYNENLPAFIFIAVIVALFMGLTVSAEEIIKDRKIQKREKFLNLSRTSYLLSKVAILFMLSAIQTITFVVLGNAILGIEGMTFTYWITLFSISCFANMLGMNVSSMFDSAVTIYIMIPLLLIPQMILSGAIFNFEKLNDLISTKGKVPIIADVMASRWGFEAIAVNHYQKNKYQRMVYDYEKAQSESNYFYTYLIPELRTRLDVVRENYKDAEGENKLRVERYLTTLRNTLAQPNLRKFFSDIDLNEDLTLQGISPATLLIAEKGLDSAKAFYVDRFNKADELKEAMLARYENSEDVVPLNLLKNINYNESLEELVKNIKTKEKFVEFEGTLIQQIDPIFRLPKAEVNPLDYRSHFLSPKKRFLGFYWDTLLFNISVIWVMVIGLYFTLYHESFRWALGASSKLFGKITQWYNKTKPLKPLVGFIGSMLKKIKLPIKFKSKA